VTPETERFWQGAVDGEFLLSECDDCGLVFHYPRALCPDCFSDEMSFVEADGTGEVYSYTIAHNVNGWPDDDLPLVTAFVELDEGPRVMTAIVDADPEEVEVGTPVSVDFVPTDEVGIAVPVFTPG
jgi:uncharacterized OB-fold protein